MKSKSRKKKAKAKVHENWFWDCWRGSCCPCGSGKRIRLDRHVDSDFISAIIMKKTDKDEEKKEQKVLKEQDSQYELSKEKGGDKRRYVEVKFPTIVQSPLSRGCWRFYRWLTDSTAIWSFFIIIISLVTCIFMDELPHSSRDGLQSFNVGFAAIFSVLISLLFSNGVEKNKKNKELFQTLCGDIKALAFYISCLTDDKDKYKIDWGEEGEGGGTIESVSTKANIEVELAKVRYLLCVLAPVAKHVLRNAPKHHKDAPNYDKLDDKFRIKIIIPETIRCCKLYWPSCLCVNKKQQAIVCFKGWKTSCFGLPLCCAKLNQVYPYEDDHSQTWGKDGGKENPIKLYLYRKIKYIADKTDMDLFEVLMYCLLDQLNVLREYRYGISGDKQYSKERDFITKWHHIYNSWGSMYSLTTYRQPVPVHLILTLSLVLYTISLSMYFKSEAVYNYETAPSYKVHNNHTHSHGSGGEYYGETGITDLWVAWYAFLQAVLTILPFTTLWSLAKTIGRPFKRGATDSNIVTKDSKDTQEQVSKLLQYRACIDKQELYQFGVDIKAEEGAAERESILTFNLEKDDCGGEKYEVVNARRRSIRPEDLTKLRKNQKTAGEKKQFVKFKNVNF